MVDSKNNMTFLIVDNQDVILTFAIKLLNKLGHKNVLKAKNGIEALKILDEQSRFVIKKPISFIITDWEMPRMNGIELVKALKQDKRFMDIPVIIVADEMTREKITYAIEEGADYYQQKPYSEASITEATRKVMEMKANPDPVQKSLLRMHAMKAQKKFKKAIEIGKEVLAQVPQNPAISLSLGECYFNLQKFDHAKACFKAALSSDQSSKALHLMGKTYMREASYQKALPFLEKANLLNPLNVDVKIDMGSTYMHLGMTKKGEEIFQGFTPEKLSDLNNTNIGAAYLDLRDIDTAGKYLYPTDPPISDAIGVYNTFGIELRKKGKYTEALAQYDKCLRLEPHNKTILLNNAYVYVAMRDWPKAKTLLEKCLEIDPKYHGATRMLDHVQSQMPSAAKKAK